MPWKDSVNSVLTRTTGYQLARDAARTREEIRAEILQEAEAKYQKLLKQREAAHKAELRDIEVQRTKRREANRRFDAQKRIEAKREAAERRATGADLPAYFDDAMKRTIAKVRPRTMTSELKLQSLIDATRHVVRHQVPGDVVECGVWRGGSMQAVALTLIEAGDTSRALHLYDTYEGMSEPTEEDVRATDGRPAEELLAESRTESGVLARAGLGDVQEGMAEIAYPQEQIHFHQGRVEETIPAQAPERIALLRLDTDWYESTKHELEHLYDRLSPGGVLILDDFGDWLGARKATEEWLEATGQPLFLAPMGSGRIAVKPLA